MQWITGIVSDKENITLLINISWGLNKDLLQYVFFMKITNY